MNQYLFTHSRCRLERIKSTPGASFNWLFLPGGPGLGSESLQGLTALLKLPGTIWHLDLPGDGSNKTPDDAEYFSHWQAALLEAVSALDQVILVAHSTGSMYVLSHPPLEKKLIGLVLMDSAPDQSWQDEFVVYAEFYPIKKAQTIGLEYSKKPSNALLKKLTIASATYSFTKEGLKAGVSLLKSLPFNFKICEWSNQYFDQAYQAKWVPKKIPTMIFAGDNDRIIPLKFFLQSKKFQRKNIIFRSIKNAGHYPWIENPKQVVRVFKEYVAMLMP